MAKVIVGMTTSLDGFVNDRNGSIERLYPDLEALRKTEFLKEAIAYTGAAVMGRHAYDMANGDLTGYEFQVPIFVITHRPPKDAPKGQNQNLSVTFVPEGTEVACKRPRKQLAPETSRSSVAPARPSKSSAPASPMSWRSASSPCFSEKACGSSRTSGTGRSSWKRSR